MGEYDLSEDGDEEYYEVRSWTSHPRYNPSTTDYDYAIVTLKKAIKFSPKASPICLPTSANYGHRNATVTGWGTTSYGGSHRQRPDILQEAWVTVLAKKKCYGPGMAYSSADITTRMICASEPGKDACQGDSGGPLITLEVTLESTCC